MQKTIEFHERREQAKNLDRVSGRLAAAIVDFFNSRRERTFHNVDLLAYVRESVGDVAPDSPGRVMRMLRREKRINYVVVSRSESLYEIISTDRTEPGP